MNHATFGVSDFSNRYSTAPLFHQAGKPSVPEITEEKIMTTRVHMQDQVTNRIEMIMQDHARPTLDDYAQTAVTVLIVFVFMTLGLAW